MCHPRRWQHAVVASPTSIFVFGAYDGTGSGDSCEVLKSETTHVQVQNSPQVHSWCSEGGVRRRWSVGQWSGRSQKYGNAETVLRSLDELQPGGTVSHVIPHRPYCAYTFFQDDSTKPCFSVQTCSSSTY